jgi:hypothetical protein
VRVEGRWYHAAMIDLDQVFLDKADENLERRRAS